MTRRFQFSLRALLVFLVLLSVLIAKQRDVLRDWLESLREGKPVNQVLIVGPPLAGTRETFRSVSIDEIASALKRAGRVNRLPKNFRLILDPVADYDDSSSGAERHHSRYKCQIIGEEETRTIYIDYNYLRVPPAEDLRTKKLAATANHRAGPCPVHGSTSPNSRSFSVNLDAGRYFCHKCRSHGNALELWAAVHKLRVYDAALDLCRALGPRRSLDQTLVKPSRNRREEAPVLFEPREDLTKTEDLSTLTVRKTGTISDLQAQIKEAMRGKPWADPLGELPARRRVREADEIFRQTLREAAK